LLTQRNLVEWPDLPGLGVSERSVAHPPRVRMGPDRGNAAGQRAGSSTRDHQRTTAGLVCSSRRAMERFQAVPRAES